MSINLRGSYRALLGNAIEALSAAVEIYNKPKDKLQRGMFDNTLDKCVGSSY